MKEFCHGDFGRCRPCLGEVLGQVMAEIRGRGRQQEGGQEEGQEGKQGAEKEQGAAKEQEGKGKAGAAGVRALPVHCEIVQLDVLDVHLEDWP